MFVALKSFCQRLMMPDANWATLVQLERWKRNKANDASFQTVSRETLADDLDTVIIEPLRGPHRIVNRTGKCLECEEKLKKPRTGRYPLYCSSCRGERSRKQNRKAANRYRAKKARAA